MIMKAIKLRCNYLEEPIAVDTAQPSLSWQCESPLMHKYQSAYRILVSSRLELLAEDNADMWDSGKIASGVSVNITYEGKKLQGKIKYYWKVAVWDEKDTMSPWSDVAGWRTGILDESAWLGQWITYKRYPEDENGNKDGLPAPMLRKVFTLEDAPKSAFVSICGLGYYELFVNGEKAGDIVLDPAPTRFDKRALYQTYDITGMLTCGENAIGVILGTGWYNCFTKEVWNFHTAPWRDEPKMLLQLDVEMTSGQNKKIISDTSWKASTGPIVFDALRNGEHYDARLEMVGWSEPNFDDSGWSDAEIIPSPGGVLESQQIPPIRKVALIKPVSSKKTGDSCWTFDIGRNISGWAKISMSGPSGKTIKIRYSEKINDDGSINSDNISCFISSGDFQTDRYTFRGEGTEIWEPRFTYHGFRYIEISGASTDLNLESLKAVVIHTDFEDAGGFECSNDLLNEIQSCARWSTLTNFHGIPTDCPHREKNGWTGDAHFSAEQFLMNFRVETAYINWLREICLAQRHSGQLPAIVPTPGWGFNSGSGPAWDSALVLIAWYLYVYRGDKTILRSIYGSIKKYQSYMGKMAKDHIVDYGLWDWCPPAGNDNCDTPTSLTDTSYYYIHTVLISKIAKIIGESEDHHLYKELSIKIRQAFRARFVDVGDGVIGTNSQTSIACAIFQSLLEENEESPAVNMLVDEITKKGFHIDTGMLGTKYLLGALAHHNRNDVVYQMTTKETFPGYGYMIKQGATTLWEGWDGGGSQNHHMFSDISNWFYKGLAGIYPDENAPGFKHIVIRPSPVYGLGWVRAWHESPYGRIDIFWTAKEDEFNIQAITPTNTYATVLFPAEYSDGITVNDLSLDECEYVTSIISGEKTVSFKVTNGNFRIIGKK